jgi:hypothetical protein
MSPEVLRPSRAPPPPGASGRPHVRPAAVTFAVVCDRAGFDALETQWNDLFACAGRDTHLFQTFNWHGTGPTIAEGIATFDLLAPAYADKDDWADAGIAVGDYAGGITWVGRAYARLYLARLRA